jgi:hypothetical protein
MKSLPRDVPFKACPHLDCGRKGRCLKLAQASMCLKTHYESKDEMFDEVTARLIAYENSDEPEDPVMAAATPDERAALWYQAFKEAAGETR